MNLQFSEDWVAEKRDLPKELRHRLSDIQDLLAQKPDAGKLAKPEPDIRVYKDDQSKLEVTYRWSGSRITFIKFGVRFIQTFRIVFLSYSHDDRAWFGLIREYLSTLEDAGDIRIWSDEEIAPGDDWRESIEKNLDAAVAALLLVSPAFLESEFIKKSELPVLLGAAGPRNGRGLRLLWILLEECEVGDEIRRYQAVGDPGEPLAELGDPEGPDAEKGLIYARLHEAHKMISRRLREDLKAA